MREPAEILGPFEGTMLAAVFSIGVLFLGLSLMVEPDPSGFGTHTQLSMAPCGFRTRTGYPCPTCGMTTSFAHFARLELGDALRVQPFGALLFAVMATSTILALFHLLAGRSARPLLRRIPRLRVLALIGLALMLASWGWTALHVL